MRTLFLAALIVLVPVHSVAQCTISPYADPLGTQQSLMPTVDYWGQSFSVYVVMFTEDTAAAAAYKLNIPGLNVDVFRQAVIAGPSGQGLFIEEPTGINVALTECVYGFGGAAILVAEYELVPLPIYFGGTYSLEANTSQGDTPVYVTCTNVIKPCAVGPDLVSYVPIPNGESSFGQIKSLYH